MPKSTGCLKKHSINDLEIKSPPSKKTKATKSNTTKQGNISTLYDKDGRNRQNNEINNISKLLDFFKESNPPLYFLEIVDTSCYRKCETKFGL